MSSGPGTKRPAERVGADLFVRGARSWPEDKDATLDVRIRGGWIEAIGSALDPEDLPILEACELALIPGLVDVHVHFRDPGLEHKEGWVRGSAGALHGGVTSVVEVQNNPPLSTSLTALLARHAHVAERSRVDFGLLANLLPDSLPELAAMAPYTPAFKCFLGGSTGLGGQTDDDTIRRLFEGAARAGRMIVAHCEDEALLKEGKRRHPDATAREHHLVRSTEAEVESVRASIRHVEATGAELHVFHVSSVAAAGLVREARARGLPVSASTAPHYLLLSCEDAPALDNRIKVNPSIKTPADAKGVLEAVRDGTIDAIGTDHAPHPLEEKLRPYSHAPSGMPSVDLLWPLTLELVRRGWLDARRALASVTSTAAQSLHLPFKGQLAPGFHGDLVLFDPSVERRVVGSELPSTARWSAYEGMLLAGFPEIVVRRGEVVFAARSTTGEAGGRALDLEPPCPSTTARPA